MKISDLRRILVVGAGTIGQEIAVQCALHGYEVVLYDIDREKLRGVPQRQRALLERITHSRCLPASTIAATLARIQLTDRPEEAAQAADLLSESVNEHLKTKREVLAQFGRLCPPHTIFTTNSSYFLPSSLAAATGRPERFAALHFHAPVWYANAVDVMPHAGTDPRLVPVLAEFARRINQVPIVLQKESPGYVFNAMLHPLLFSALALASAGVATVEDIDRAWMVVTKMPIGPFGIIDKIGLSTVHELVARWAPLMRQAQAPGMVGLLKERLDQGLPGEESGEGFYRYPHPAFAAFLTTKAGSPARTDGPAGRCTKQRFLLRSEPEPLHPRLRLAAPRGARCMILGSGDIAAALAGLLRDAAAEVVQVDPGAGSDEDLRRARAAMEPSPPRHLFVVTGCQDQASSQLDRRHAGQRFDVGVRWPYFVAQQWFQRLAADGQLDRASFVAVTRLGGDFGLSGRIEVVEGGGFSALAKAMFLEAAAENSLGPGVKVVDLPRGASPAQSAAWIVQEWIIAQQRTIAGSTAELRRHHADVEVGYKDQQRQVIRLMPAPLDRGTATEAVLTPGSGWIVTGGGRGITARLAEALGLRYGIRLHLLGRTPMPAEDYRYWSEEQISGYKAEVMRRAYRNKEKPNVAWEQIERQIALQTTLHRLQQAGVRAEYHTADVGDAASLMTVLEQARRQGPLEGILHGAGFEHTARFERKSEADFRATVAVKSLAAIALAELTRQDPLRYWIGMGSLSGRFGGIGQTDYALANDLLAKTVAWIGSQRPNVRCLTVHWPGWEDIGMTARPASRYALEKAGRRLMPVDEGIEHFLAELSSDSPSAEVVLVGDAELPWELRSRVARGQLV